MKNRSTVKCCGVALVAILIASFSLAGSVTVSNVSELTNAIAQAQPPIVIVLKPGVYDLSTLEPFVVSNNNGFAWGTNCTVDGYGFAHIVFKAAIRFQGENTKHWSEKTPAEETIIRGAGASDTMRLMYAYTGTGRQAMWSHITFENAGSSTVDGGALCIMGPHLAPTISVTNCVFRGNRANVGGATFGLSVADSLYEDNTALKGGAACVVWSDIWDKGVRTGTWTNTLANCIFRNNVSTGTGGGAVNAQNPVIITDCVFSNNTASASGSGGAVKIETGTGMNVTRCTFVDNVAAGQGGGIYAASTLGGFKDCTFLRNSAVRGGAAWVDQPVGSIDSCLVVSNTATQRCAGCYQPGLGRAVDSTFAFNTTSDGPYAGLTVTNFSACASVTNCLFEANVASAEWNAGSQLCGAKDVVGCTFRGYGDMIAKNYDRCVFERCAFDYDNWGGGMLLFDTRTGAGHLRNCLFTNNTAHVYIDNASGAEVEIANCTFADNFVKPALNLGKTSTTNDGYLVYAFRGGDGGKDAQGNALGRPSTNRVVNCIFANNTWRGGVQKDISAYRTETNVATPAQNIFSHCLYEIATFGTGSSEVTMVDPIVAKPGFVAGSARYADQPPCMIRRTSKARRAGLVLPWMADATDIVGTPMVSEDGAVDLGAYQCTLPALGSLMLFR